MGCSLGIIESARRWSTGFEAKGALGCVGDAGKGSIVVLDLSPLYECTFEHPFLTRMSAKACSANPAPMKHRGPFVEVATLLLLLQHLCLLSSPRNSQLIDPVLVHLDSTRSAQHTTLRRLPLSPPPARLSSLAFRSASAWDRLCRNPFARSTLLSPRMSGTFTVLSRAVLQLFAPSRQIATSRSPAPTDARAQTILPPLQTRMGRLGDARMALE